MSGSTYVDILSDEIVRLCERAKEKYAFYMQSKHNEDLKELADSYNRHKWYAPWRRPKTTDQICAEMEAKIGPLRDLLTYYSHKIGPHDTEITFFNRLSNAAQDSPWVHITIEDHQHLTRWSGR